MTKAQQLKKKQLKEKTCAYSKCENTFIPHNGWHKTCGWRCAIDYQKEIVARRKVKENRKALKEFRDGDKSILRKDAQKIANRLGKLQDLIKGNPNCVTCGGYSKNQMDGGHAYPTSTYSPIRYYTLQIRNQCVKCNRFNGGMASEFKEYLTLELGAEKVLWLESHKGQITKKFTVEYLQKYKRVMGKRLKQQEKRYTMKGFAT